MAVLPPYFVASNRQHPGSSLARHEDAGVGARRKRSRSTGSRPGNSRQVDACLRRVHAGGARPPTARLPVRRVHCGNSAVSVGTGRYPSDRLLPDGRPVTTLRVPQELFDFGRFREPPVRGRVPHVRHRWELPAARSGAAPERPPWRWRAKPYAVGRRTGRAQEFFSQGNFASKCIEASCAVSRFGSRLIEVGVGCWSGQRWRRLWALRRPPMRPMVRHWSMVLW